MIDNKTLNCDEDVVGFTVEPNKFYSFYINDTENLNCSFQFYSDKENYFYSFVQDIEPLKNGYETLNGDETILTKRRRGRKRKRKRKRRRRKITK